MSPGSPTQCPARDRLENLVQHILRHLAELSRSEAEIIKSGDRDRMLAIDKEIEMTIGEKERAMGALFEHREAHGC